MLSTSGDGEETTDGRTRLNRERWGWEERRRVAKSHPVVQSWVVLPRDGTSGGRIFSS